MAQELPVSPTQPAIIDSVSADARQPIRLVETARPLNNQSMARIVAVIAFLVGCFHPLAGCAKHEYVITQPPESAGRLTRQERTIDWEPVIYHFVDQSSRVGIRIENPTSSPLIIKGEDSYIVTPDGQSSPMRGGTIAPMTWTGITIPALVRVYGGGGGGMSFGLGVGSWGSSGGGGVGVGYSPWNDGYSLPR